MKRQTQKNNKTTSLTIAMGLIFLNACSKSEKPDFPQPQPEPQSHIEYPCPKEGDIYRL